MAEYDKLALIDSWTLSNIGYINIESFGFCSPFETIKTLNWILNISDFFLVMKKTGCLWFVLSVIYNFGVWLCSVKFYD